MKVGPLATVRCTFAADDPLGKRSMTRALGTVGAIAKMKAAPRVPLASPGPREVLLLGAVPESTAPRVGLCASVRAAARRVAELVVELLRADGLRLEPRATTTPRVAWWQTSTEFEAFHVAGNSLPD